jgi:ligand-binding sensor domain-containing protein
MIVAAAALVAQCVLPTTPVLASATVGDTRATLTPGAVRYGDHVATGCDTLPAPHPIAIAAWHDRLAIGFRDGGLWTWDGDTFVAVAGLPAAPVRALAATGDTLWIGTADGLWSIHGDTTARFDHATLGKRPITALASRGATVLVGIDPRGLWKITGDAVRRIDKQALVGCFAGATALPPGPSCMPAAADLPVHVTAFARHAGRLVVGTFDDGMWQLVGRVFSRIPSGPRFVDALLVDGDTLYVASATGLYAAAGTGDFARVELGLPSTHVNDLAKAGDTLWLATSRGLAAWDGRSVRVLDTGDARVVYAVAIASDGAVWAGTIAGAIRFAAGSETRFDRARGTLPGDWVTSLVPDTGGAVLAGTYDAGVMRLAADGTAAPVDGLDGKLWINPHGLARLGDTIVAATLGDGWRLSGRADHPELPDDDVTATIRIGGTVWIGTRGGLARIAM